MILAPIRCRVTPNNCAFILMDYQARYASATGSTHSDILIHNAINLAKIARTFSIPTLLTTIGDSSFGGPIFLHRDWASTKAYEAMLNIARDHASAHGLEIQYERPGLGEEETNRRDDRPKERGWGKWSMLPGRPLKKIQKRP